MCMHLRPFHTIHGLIVIPYLTLFVFTIYHLGDEKNSIDDYLNVVIDLKWI